MEQQEPYVTGAHPVLSLPPMIEGLRAEIRSLLDHMTVDNYAEQLQEIRRIIFSQAWRDSDDNG